MNQYSAIDEMRPSIHQETNVNPERGEGSVDSFSEIVELEKQHLALNYIRERYAHPHLDEKKRALAPLTSSVHSVEQINNQFAKRIIPAFMHQDLDQGLGILRQVQPHTTEQELILLISDEEFYDMAEGAKQYVNDEAENINFMVGKRLDPENGQIAWNDKYQFNSKESDRSLAEIEKNGMTIELDPSELSLVVEAYRKSRETHLPLLEILKNERIVSVNKFHGSKISLAVHDTVDHAWVFNLVKKHGLDTKFREFFTSIGDPAETDMFKREGEIIASIGFGVRYGSTQENGFKPLVECSDLSRIMSEYFFKGVLSERHMEAYRIIQSLPPYSREAMSLGFTYSNYIAELDEQRRKHGKIKVKNASGEITGELSELDPDFLSLFIETHHHIMASQNKHRDNLFRVHIIMEEWLQRTAETGQCIPLNIDIAHLSEHDYSKTPVPAMKLKWMFKNYGFTATKELRV